MKIYSRFDRPAATGLVCPEHSLTEQVYKDQCDLNFLIKKYHLEDDPFSLKMMVDPNTRKSVFLDTTQVPDIYTALQQHQHVKHIFEALDYEIQKKFDFSVDAFAEYCLTAPIKDVAALGVPNLEFITPESVTQPTSSPSASEEVKAEESKK